MQAKSAIVHSAITIIFSFFGLLGILPTSKAREGDQANIVLFLIDDLGWKDVGCYGSDYY